MTRYHPFLVFLHWLLAAMIIGALIMGELVLEKTPNSDPGKLLSLKLHMLVGLSVLGLMLVRIVVRLLTKSPPHASTGNTLLDKLGGLTHLGLYAVVIAMTVSGILISRAAGLPDIVFFGSGTPLPADFNDIAARNVHNILAKLIALLVLLHVAGFLFHKVVIKDNLIKRMWFGPRES